MKDIIGYEGLYAITSCGKVWSYKTKKFLKPFKVGHGYLKITLCKDGNCKDKKIHRLVAEAYLPNPNNYDTVDHIDFNTTNNCVNNLQWMSRSENSRKKRSVRKIYCFENEKIYESQTQAAKELGLNQGNISRVCQGIFKQTGGYHFKFVIEEGTMNELR